MPREGLLAVELEAVERGEHHHLVVHGLARQPLAVGRGAHGRQRVHRRIRDVLHVHRDVPTNTVCLLTVCTVQTEANTSREANSPLPYSQTLVIRGGDESSVIIYEGDCIDSSEVTVVFLHYFTCAGVPL